MKLLDILKNILSILKKLSDIFGSGDDFANTVEGAAKKLTYNKVLWNGAYYMSEGHTATLSEAISAQPHGIILVWSRYNSGAEDTNWNYSIVPKNVLDFIGGGGSTFVLCNAGGGNPARKYLYFTNTTIKGYSHNTDNGTAGNIAWNNSYFVLRKVVGF